MCMNDIGIHITVYLPKQIIKQTSIGREVDIALRADVVNSHIDILSQTHLNRL